MTCAESFDQAINGMASWVWGVTVPATVLIVIALLVQRLFRGVLPPRWSYAVSLLVFLRLALPFAPASRLSVFNLEKQAGFLSSFPAAPQHSSDTRFGSSALALGSSPVVEPESFLAHGLSPALAAAANRPIPPDEPVHFLSAIGVMKYVWLLGCLTMLGSLLWRQRQFTIELRSWEQVHELQVLELLAHCQAVIGVRGRLTILVAKQLHTPALFGIFRPRLLIPAEMLRDLDQDELRHIFLHELVHLKRGDVLVNWAGLMLRALHWFNPFVWVALRRLRAEQELACDAAVMAGLTADERLGYGGTLLRLLEAASVRGLCPGAVPFNTNKQTIKRRIKMIAQFKPAGRLVLTASMVITVGLACVTFTRADGDIAASLQPTPGNLVTGLDNARIDTERAGLRAGHIDLRISTNGSIETLVADNGVVLQDKLTGARVTGDHAVLAVSPAAPTNALSASHHQIVSVNVTSDGSMHLNNEPAPISQAALRNLLQDAMATNPGLILKIQGDGSTSYAAMRSLLDLAAQLQLKNILLDAAPDAPSTVRAPPASYDLAANSSRTTPKQELAKVNAEIAALAREITAGDQPPKDWPAPGSASDAAFKLQLDQSILGKQNELLQKETLFGRLDKLAPDELRQVLPTTIPDAMLTELLQQLDAAQAKLTELASTLGLNNPEVVTARDLVAEVNSQVDARVKGIMKALQVQADTDRDVIEKLQAKRDGNAEQGKYDRLYQLHEELDKLEKERDYLKDEAVLRDVQNPMGVGPGQTNPVPLEPGTAK
jgi:bla regulator protein BlaR1